MRKAVFVLLSIITAVTAFAGVGVFVYWLYAVFTWQVEHMITAGIVSIPLFILGRALKPVYNSLKERRDAQKAKGEGQSG